MKRPPGGGKGPTASPAKPSAHNPATEILEAP